MLRIPEPAPRNVFGGPIVLAVCTMLAACGGAAGPAPSAGQLAPAGSSAAAESPKASTSSASPAPAAGSAGPVSSAAALPIKIGVLDALTGQNATSGKENVDGTRLYLDSVNNTLGGRKVEVIVADTVAQADVALTKAKQLVENDKVNVLMGFGLTPECYAVAGYVKQVHVPMIISDNCGAQGLTTNPKFASPYISAYDLLLVRDGLDAGRLDLQAGPPQGNPHALGLRRRA